MPILNYLKSALSNNFPTMIVLALVWWNLNSKMTKLLIEDTVKTEKIIQLDKRICSNDTKVSTLQLLFYTHLGDAKKEEDD